MSDDIDIQPHLARTLFRGRAGGVLTAALGVLCVGAVGLAAVRHTGSLAFPIDDGYIYSNYVLAASQGHPFTYNIGETSGGITGLGWYLLCLLFYGLLAPFHDLLGGLAPAAVRGAGSVQDQLGISAQAGHLYLSAYLPGALCLIATGLGVRKVAGLTLPHIEGKAHTRDAVCWLLGAVAVADLGLVWGAMSGLEAALSSSLAVWASATLIGDYQRGRLRWSLALAFLLPWARPDLLVFGVVGVAWLLLRALFDGTGKNTGRGFSLAGSYALACIAGFGLMSLAYYWGWGRPLPSSFYAKVGGLRFGSRFFSAATELLVAGRYLPFVAGLVTLLGGLVSVVVPPSRGLVSAELRGNTRWAAGLMLLVAGGYVAAIMFTLPWFGQEDRYLLPVHPFAIVLCGLLLWRLVAALHLESVLRSRAIVAALASLIMLLLAFANYVWATRDYVVEVRNIYDGHIAPAIFLSNTAAPNSIVASEPIGAVKLFSGLPTIDLVGLTTPATLGTYRNWPLAWEALRKAHVSYLLFYPNWFDDKCPPPWAIEQARFPIPDNRIAGDSVIAVYQLRWDLYEPLPTGK